MKKQIKIDHQIFDFSDQKKEKLVFSKNEQFLSEILEFCVEWFNESPSIQVFSSGSTGEPKKMLMPKKWMEESALRTIQRFNLVKGNTILLSLPISFIAGKMMVVRAILGELDLVTTFPNATPKLPNVRIDFAAFTPMQCHNLLENDDDCFSKIDQVIIGGGAISPTLWDKLAQLKTSFYSTYGMTETATHVALQAVKPHSKRGEFQLIDSSIVIATDNRGCLSLRIPYFDDLEIQTNDLVDLKNAYSFELLGRIDRVVNSGGRKIQLDQLEIKCSQFLDMPFYFCGIDDEVLGQKLVLMLETSAAFDAEKLDTLIQNMEKLDRPKLIETRPKFNYTHSGKIIKEYFYEK